MYHHSSQLQVGRQEYQVWVRFHLSLELDYLFCGVMHGEDRSRTVFSTCRETAHMAYLENQMEDAKGNIKRGAQRS